MSLQILKYSKDLSTFTPLKNLEFYREFALFKTFKAFETLKALRGFEHLHGIKESKHYKALEEFKEFKEFEEFLGNLSFMSYYRDFDLLLCSPCSLSLNPSSYRGHLANYHFRGIKGKEREALIARAIGVLSTLEVSPLPLSLESINSFSIVNTLPPFRELKLLSNLSKCTFCPYIISNEINMKRHLSKKHQDRLLGLQGSKVDKGYIVIAKGQCLEKSRYFFEVERPRDKGKGREVLEEEEGGEGGEEGEGEDEEEGESLGNSTPLNIEGDLESNSIIIGEEDDPISRASALFLKDFQSKKETLLGKLKVYSLNKREPLSPLQKQTQYIQFLDNKNLESLISLSSNFKEGDKEEDPLLNILIINLKELFYLSLEKSRYINKLPLQYLNSFQKGVIKNTPFKPLLRANSRVKYFDFFSSFFAFTYRSFYSGKYKKDGLYSLSKEASTLLKELRQLAIQGVEEASTSNLDLNREFKRTKKAFNRSLNSFKLHFLLNKGASLDKEDLRGEEWEGEEGDSSTISSLGSSNAPSISSTSSSSKSLEGEEDSSSTISIDSTKSISNDVLEEIELVGKGSNNLISIKIRERLLDLFILLFKQEVSLYIFSSPINSFLASKSIRASNCTLRDSLSLSQFYSYFIYCSQLLVLEYSLREAISKGDSTLILKGIQDFMFGYFNNASLSPLSEILNNRSYCFRINKEISSLSNITIHPHLKDTLSYSRVTISKGELERVFKEAILHSSDLLLKELLFNIPLGELKDFNLESFSNFEDYLDMTPYKCFKDFHPNIEYYNDFLISRVFKTPSLRSRFFTLRDGKLEVKRQALKLYIKGVKEFLRFCLLLIHFTSGLPLRGSELCTFKFLNSFKDKRELILDKASTLFIINISTTNKGLREANKRCNIRYLSKSVSTIFLYYIVLVVPFLEKLIITTSPSSSSNISLSPFFFIINKELLTPKDLSTKISTFTNLILGKKLNIQVYRQIILGVIKYFMLERLEEASLSLEEGEEGEEGECFNTIIASQMNHSLNVEELHYARPTSTFSNVKNSTQLKYLSFSLRFFHYFNILEVDLSSNLMASALQLENALRENTKDDLSNTLALRFNKTSPSSSSPPPTLPLPPPSLNNNNEKSLILSSRKHLRNASSISSALQREQVLKRVKLKDLQSISSSTSSSKVLLSLLREFLNDREASFRCLEQELLIKSILLKVPYILGILGTNKGKSFSYLFTSSLITSKITIVILPLLGLKTSIWLRAKDFNIPISIFEETSTFSNLTLISIETIIKNDAFITSLMHLIQEDRIDRIIIDECHLLITSRSYRSIMFQLKKLLKFQVQFVFLSGTIPLYIEEALREEFLFDKLSIIRGITIRTNITYITKQYNSTIERGQFLEVKEYLEAYYSKFSSLGDKVLIICPTIPKIKALSEFLSCPSYYSDLEDKGEILESYLTSKEEKYRVLISSSSLEEGIDYPFIRLVIYIDFIHSFIGLLQGSSRGGRDNLESTSIFFYLKGEELDREGDTTIDKSYIRKYLRESVCKQRVISLFLDNIIMDKCPNSISKCDLCLGRDNIQRRTIGNIENFNKDVQVYRDSLRELILKIQPYCLACLLLRGQPPLEEEHTTLRDCPHYYSSLSKELYSMNNSRKLIREQYLKEDSCCFYCYLPSYICSSLKKEGSRCCNIPLMFNLCIICLVYYKELDLEEDLKVKTFNRWNFYSLAKVFFSKVFIKKLDTQAILGIVILRKLSLGRL
jgi:superfamily II DNA helicase RecQ